MKGIQRRYSILGGTVITVAMRWSDRLIGLVSTIILARLLAPEDFGIIAMAALAIGLADVLLDLGVNIALIRNPDATQAHYDTAWTLRLAQTAIATLALILVSPFAADYFDDERLGPVLQLLAFSLLLSGCENIGVVAFQKHMQFGAEFRYLFLRRIAGFVITVSLAWLLQSYWALVIGALCGRAIGVSLSYALHPMRPRLSLEKFQDIFAVSQWVVIRSIGSYLQGNLHKILVGRWASTPTMGAYSLADDISAMPSSELLAPLNRVLFPAFSGVQHNLEDLKRLYIRAQAVQTLMATPAAAGLALVAEEAVRVLLGEKWLVSVPFVQVLALVGIAQALTTSGGYVLIVLGRMRSLVLLTWAQVLLFVVSAFLLLPQQEALAVAWLRLLVATAGIWLAFWLLIRALPIVRWQEILRASIRPLSGAAAMAAVLASLPPTNIPIAALLVLKIVLGAITYMLTIMGAWWLAGRPDGAESYVLGLARAGFARHRASSSFRRMRSALTRPTSAVAVGQEAAAVLLVMPWSPTLPGGVSVVVRYLLQHLEAYPLKPVLVVNDWTASRLQVDAVGNVAFRLGFIGRATWRDLLKAAVIAPTRLARTLRMLRHTRAASVNFHYPSLDVFGVALLKRLGLYRGRLALSFHGTDLRPPRTMLERRLWRFVLSETEGISACSIALAARVAEVFGLDPEGVAVIYNGVDADIFAPQARSDQLRPALPQRYIASVGSYLPRKGHRVLLEAFARVAGEFPDTSLAIAGSDGPERGSLLERAAQLGLADRVACFADLSHPDTAALLAGAQACVQAAHAEPFGLAVIEAGACGVPVAASSVSGHSELLRDRETGFLFRAGDVAACAAVLRELLGDRETAVAVANRFRAEVLRSFSWQDCARAYFALNTRD